MKSASLLIAAFLTLILGVAGILVTISAQEQELIALDWASNETLDMSSARDPGPAGSINSSVTLTLSTHEYATDPWKIGETDCNIANFALFNQSGDTMTETTDYVLNAAVGTLTLVNNSNMNDVTSNISSTSYQYCPDEFLTQSWTRSVMDVVIGFFALSLLIVSVGIFYQIAKQEGLFGYGI